MRVRSHSNHSNNSPTSTRIPLAFTSVLCVGLVCGASDQCMGENVGGQDGWPQVVRMVREYCVACHSGEEPSGAFTFSEDLLSSDSLQGRASRRSRDFWERVAHKLDAQQMPPLGEARPNTAVYQNAYGVITHRLDELAHRHPLPGAPPTMRRLTRYEYQSAVRDLLDLEIDPARWLPADDASHGFDNVTVSGLSPTLLNRYVTAAQRISRLAIGGPLPSPGGRTFRIPGDLTQERHIAGLPLGTRGGGTFRYVFPRDGEYEVTVRLARDRNEHVEGLRDVHPLILLLDRSQFAEFKIRRPKDNNHSLVDAHLRQRFRATAGVHTLGVTFPKHSAPLLSTLRQPYDARFNYHRHPRTMPAVFQVSITGPYGESEPGDAASRRLLLGEAGPASPPDREQAKRTLGAIMRRAYRRPVEPSDYVQPMRFFDSQPDDYERGMELALTTILASPHFLFRMESNSGVAEESRPLTPHELASRLSFFLWSSIPDEALLSAADSGRLRDTDELLAQTRRMLRDSRSESLVKNFASQWLHLRNLDTLTPDLRAFPDFDHNLRQSFRSETEAFFRDIVRGNASIVDLITADYTYLNERLAKHYGIPKIYGDHLRRVTLPQSAEGPRRGGLLRHGSILTVTSYATRTSPVLRGNWILENLVGAPPPPPPANVPALKEKTFEQPLTVRERLAEHRADPACASCHDLMDPVGFALENYDAVGRWRETDDGSALDTRGELANGMQFDGVEQLEQSIAQQPNWLASCLARKLLTYALGRGVEPNDGAAVRQIVRQAADNDYRFSSLVEGIVLSQPFRFRDGRIQQEGE